MRVSILGAGHIGGTIGSKWEAAGHDVVYGLRDPSKMDGAVSIAEAARAAGVVLLAVPGDVVSGLVREHAVDLDGKILIDATNNPRGASMNSWPEISRAVPGAQLYRAFNIYGWDVLTNPLLGGARADLFYAGPEGEAKETVERLIFDADLRPIWVGGPDRVDLVDALLRLWFTLAQDRGRRIAFTLISD